MFLVHFIGALTHPPRFPKVRVVAVEHIIYTIADPDIKIGPYDDTPAITFSVVLLSLIPEPILDSLPFCKGPHLRSVQIPVRFHWELHAILGKALLNLIRIEIVVFEHLLDPDEEEFVLENGDTSNPDIRVRALLNQLVTVGGFERRFLLFQGLDVHLTDAMFEIDFR